MSAARLVIILGVAFYGLTAVIASIAINGEIEDGFWWPILLIKALLKSLYRALFTEWNA